MKTLILTIFFSFFALLNANIIGIVQKVDGIVKVKHQNSIKKEKVKQGYEIQTGDIISTFRNSAAVLELKDKSKVALKIKRLSHF